MWFFRDKNIFLCIGLSFIVRNFVDSCSAQPTMLLCGTAKGLVAVEFYSDESWKVRVYCVRVLFFIKFIQIFISQLFVVQIALAKCENSQGNNFPRFFLKFLCCCR